MSIEIEIFKSGESFVLKDKYKGDWVILASEFDNDTTTVVIFEKKLIWLELISTWNKDSEKFLLAEVFCGKERYFLKGVRNFETGEELPITFKVLKQFFRKCYK